MVRYILVMLSFLAAWECGGKAFSPNIVFIGNSITHGAKHADWTRTAPPNACAEWHSVQDGIDEVHFLNMGKSGKTTFHFLPDRDKVVPVGDKSYFNEVVDETRKLVAAHPDQPLVFSFMLGTNDSAERPRNHATTKEQYVENMTTIIDSLLTLWPDAHIVLNRVIYYTPGFVTKSGTVMDDIALSRVRKYYECYPEIIAKSKKGHVHVGDTMAYDHFKENWKTDIVEEKDREGKSFWLHPNEKGSKVLCQYWGGGMLPLLYNLNPYEKRLTLSQNVLEGKKWVACGDSFTQGDFHNGELGGDSKEYRKSDKYFDKDWNMYKTYPWHIAKRNNMVLVNEAICGTCMGSSEKRKDNFIDGRYMQIPKDADYITLWFGINDRHQKVPVGDIESTDTATFYGAWNTALEYIIEHHPYAKICIIVTTGTHPEYSEAERQVARRWGIPYLDLEQDPSTPLTMRSDNREGTCKRAFELRNLQLQVSDRNRHPNLKAHELLSTVVENFMRSL